ncbi:DUF1802 family protein [Paenibacillus alkalitolerans]|uniref:DUF1802 family protein n=1 Tax=Paenibacillus alkalitolerans TaxID=2799335 RepID=UPI0018F78AF2|nr:DUF1802 family protein [Paenibacillus alkalitolerans]
MNTNFIALKEWASAIEAFTDGRQIIALRKGGIHEETREFKLESDSFLFFPAYEHQKEHLIKEQYRHYVSDVMRRRAPDDQTFEIRAWAEVVEDVPIRDENQLKAIDDFHIWTDDYAQERLRWKRTQPLHCLLLRVHVLERPVTVYNDAAFTGCKSWIRLELPAVLPDSRPAMSGETFSRTVADIKKKLSEFESGN